MSKIISLTEQVRDLILDISIKGTSGRIDFRHISKGEQVREMILDISVKRNKHFSHLLLFTDMSKIISLTCIPLTDMSKIISLTFFPLLICVKSDISLAPLY
jgi:hypothetical protein